MHNAVSEIDNRLLVKCQEMIKTCVGKDGKIIVVGNGGSAGIASHIAVDFTKAAKIRAVCFNEAALLTCFANDFGYENWVSEALKSYADNQDLVILISSSGKSQNIINAAKYCNDKNLSLITLTGFNFDNPVRSFGNVSLWVKSRSYNFIEMAHHIWLLSLIDCAIAETTTNK